VVEGAADIDVTVAEAPQGDGAEPVPATGINESLDDATQLQTSQLDDFVYRLPSGISKVRMIRQVDVRIAGKVWRFEVGRARARSFMEEREFSEADQITPIRTTLRKHPDWKDPTLNPGDVPPGQSNYWLPVNPGQNNELEDRDFFRLRVPKASEVAVNWSGVPIETRSILEPDLFKRPCPSCNEMIPIGPATCPSCSQPIPGVPVSPLFPVFFDGENRRDVLVPIQPSAGVMQAEYAIPDDGFIVTGAALAPADRRFPPGHPRAGQRITNTVTYPFPDDPTTPNVDESKTPENAAYNLQISVYRTDRIIAIDPLMATYLDKVIAAPGGDIAENPLANRRLYFADFRPENKDVAASGETRAFVIPRLNWALLADNPNFDAAIAAAERICRINDSPATRAAASADDAPAPEFDSSEGAAIRSQSAGRMTWMLTVQPETPGSVEANWRAGQPFEASVVIFQDRPFPKPGDSVGEYAFEAGWSDSDGMLHVHVPLEQPDGARLSEDDVKRLFASGSWLLLGPQLSARSAISENLALEWIKIRSSQLDFRKGPDGEAKVIAHVLLDREPAENVLLRSGAQLDAEERIRVMAFAYDGVVAVVKRSITVKDPRSP
jgi:hypothetical protein